MDQSGSNFDFDYLDILIGQTPKSDIPPNIAPNVVTPENYLQIWYSSATLIGQLATVTIFGAMLGGIPLSGAYPFIFPQRKFESRGCSKIVLGVDGDYRRIP